MVSKDCLIMMMWLAAYYNFFLERVRVNFEYFMCDREVYRFVSALL